MIISHKHKFIFIHTNKCAGTSIEVSLTSICGSDDIIGPVTLENLPLDYKHPENYDKNKFEDTMSAKDIKDNIPLEYWEEYTKFSVVRNPWDRMVSAWFWQTRGGREFVNRNLQTFLSNPVLKPISMSEQLTVNDSICTDFLIRYENLNDDYKKVCKLLKISPIKLPYAKSGYKPKDAHYTKYYDGYTKNIIETKFKDDINNFGYKFGD